MKVIHILKNRIRKLWLRLAKSESASLSAPNDLGFTSDEMELLLNQRRQTSRIIKIVPEGQHLLQTYSTEQFEAFFGIPYLSQLTVTSYDLLKIVINQCPWIFRTGILGMEGDDLYPYFLDKIYNGAVANVTIGWIDSHLGYGVFANEHLDKGAFIGSYTGVIRPISRLLPNHNEYCLLYPTKFWSKTIFVIDAGKGGNEIRFINHSDNPNLSLECLYDRGLLHFFLCANQPIGKGAHLTFNYGEAFWQYRPSKKLKI